MRKRDLKWPLALLSCWLTAASPAAEAGGIISEISLAPTISFYQWEEHAERGRLLREEGPLFGVAGGIRSDLLRTASGQALSLSGTAELYGGVVDYDGHTQSDQPKNDYRPLRTDVGYIGWRGGFDLGWMIPLRGSRLGPLAGVDYRVWLRDLQGSTASDTDGVPFPVSGVTELWQNATLRLGARWEAIPLGGGWNLFAEGGAVYPFYTANQIDVADYGTVTITPRGEWSGFGETGIRNNRLRIALRYEGLRFGRSSTVPVSAAKGYYQPESAGDFIGVSVGYCFR